MEPENTTEYEPLFDPNDPGEIAAKDQILTMLAGKWEAFNAIAHMDSASLKELCNKDGWYLTGYRFIAQALLTLLEERKLIMRAKGPVWPPLESDSVPLSPGWKFLLNLCKDPDEPLENKEAAAYAASLFASIMKNSLGGLKDEEEFKAAMDNIPNKVKDEMKIQIDSGGPNAMNTVEHLSNWLWMLSDPTACSAMNARLLQLINDGNPSVDLCNEGLTELQLKLAVMKEMSEKGEDYTFMDPNLTADEMEEERRKKGSNDDE